MPTSRWQRDRFSATVEFSDSKFPGTTSTLNFINPNSATGTRIDNGVPVQFDLTGGALAFGIAQGLPTTPTVEMLLDPANYVLAQFNQSASKTENREDAFRTDFSYDLERAGITTVEVGYRYNQSSSEDRQGMLRLGQSHFPLRSPSCHRETSSLTRPR